MQKNDQCPDVDAFWQASCGFYAKPAVKDCLLDMQNGQKKNVNQLLFALWVSSYFHHQFSFEEVLRLLKRTRRTENWIEKVRRLRLELSQDDKPRLQNFQRIREILLKSELNMERLHQKKLVTELLKELPTKLSQKQKNLNVLMKDNLAMLAGGELEVKDHYDFLISEWLKFTADNSLSSNKV